MAKLTKPIKIGPAELSWTYLNGDGNLNELKVPPAYEYKSTAILSPKMAEPYVKEIKDFWALSGIAKEPKSLGYKINKETGNYEFTFKTNTEFPKKDGTKAPAIVRVFRANGTEITKQFHAQEKKCANGSEGVVHGTMAIYDRKTGSGVTLYLNAVQFTKFIEYTGGVEVDKLDSKDDGLDTNDGLNVEDENLPPV